MAELYADWCAKGGGGGLFSGRQDSDTGIDDRGKEVDVVSDHQIRLEPDGCCEMDRVSTSQAARKGGRAHQVRASNIDRIDAAEYGIHRFRVRPVGGGQ